MTATIPPNHIVCPRCIDYPRLSKATSIFAGFACSACHGEGHIINPLINEWLTSTTPARLIELLGDKADADRLDMFGHECDIILSSRVEFTVHPNESGRWYWTTMAAWEHKDCTVKPSEACAIIRCLWPNPFIERERVECPECKNGQSGEHVYDQSKGLFVYIDREMHRKACMTCEGFGDIEDHTIDQRWLSSTVLDLAKVIRGTVCERCEGTGKPYGADRTYNPPNKCPVCNGAKFKESPRPELMPVLADALLDAGCDNEEVIEHCQSGGPHVVGCWVISEILKGPI